MPAARVATPPDGGSTRPRDIEQPQGPGITCARLCQHIPSRVKEGGQVLASRVLHRGYLQQCRVGAGMGTCCSWWPQTESCLSMLCHLQAQRPRQGPPKLTGSVRFALHFLLVPGMKSSRGRMWQDCHQSLSWGLLGPT